MVTFAPNCQDQVRRISVASEVPIEQLGIDGDHCVYRQRLAGRQLVVGSEPFPLDRSERVLEQGFKQFLVNTFAVRAIGHDENARLAMIEAHCIASPALIVAFFEKYLAVRSIVQAPCQAVAEMDRSVLLGSVAGQTGELVLRE